MYRGRCLEFPRVLPSTLPETNIAPENRPLGKEIPIENHHFLGAMLVLGSVILEFPLNKASRNQPSSRLILVVAHVVQINCGVRYLNLSG